MISKLTNSRVSRSLASMLSHGIRVAPGVLGAALVSALVLAMNIPQDSLAGLLGGHGFNISPMGDAVSLHWLTGSIQTGYSVQRYRLDTGDLATLPLSGPLPASATSYTDNPAPTAPECYAVLALGTAAQAYSDLECVLMHSHSPAGAPQAFTIQLNQSSVAALSWTAPVEGGQSGYLLLPLGQQPLMLDVSTTQQSVSVTGATCFVVGALQNNNHDLEGFTDVLCGVPGFSNLDTTAGAPTATPPGRTSTPSPTRTPTPSATPGSPSGVAMPTGDLPGWHQIFADDFTQDAPIGQFDDVYGSRWSPYPDGWANTAGYGAKSRYYPSKVVSAANGMMQINLHSESLTNSELNINGGFGNSGTYALDAAMQPAQNGTAINQLYGKYTVRFRTDSLPGFYSAWLLWPQSENWPTDGEIDFPEGNLNGGMCGFLHHEGGTSGSDQDAFCPSSAVFASGWHTASTEWGPTQTRFILDDVVIGTSTTRIPNTPMRYVLQNEACRFSCPAATTSGVIQVDWFVMYAYAP